MILFQNGNLILEDRIFPDGALLTAGKRIYALGNRSRFKDAEPDKIVDLAGGYLSAGFIDIHTHGGDNADFMDGTAEAFQTVCKAHARHGTTSLTPTSCVAEKPQILKFLDLCRELQHQPTGGAKVLGAHFYGPYFLPEAKGCHPSVGLCAPDNADYLPYLDYADCIRTATVAPELPGAEEFVRACRSKGIRCNAGHSWATFDQMEQAIGWGVRHVDHLFCAMSDRARLRLSQTFPMRGGVLEATLFFDELTTEVIADGRHLAPELLRMAWKMKGSNRLAVVTDSSRAMDMPDGEYYFGTPESREPFRKQDGVGVTLDGKALASSVVGMDVMLRVMRKAIDAPLPELLKSFTLTPARVIGLEKEIGSLEAGKRADLVVLSKELEVRGVFVDGEPTA